MPDNLTLARLWLSTEWQGAKTQPTHPWTGTETPVLVPDMSLTGTQNPGL